MRSPESERLGSSRGAEAPLLHRINCYADAVTRQDVGSVARLFTADGEWIVAGYGDHRGHEAIAAFLAGLLEGWDVIVHALLSGRIHPAGADRPDPDRATGRWYISEFGRRADGTEVFFAGVYDDDYVLDAGVWRFARRRYGSLFRASPPRGT